MGHIRIIYPSLSAAMNSRMQGYNPKTTFWTDFSIADFFGYDAIMDTYKRAFEEWKGNVTYFAELSLVMNWKCWEHYNKKDEEGMKLYRDLSYQTRQYASENLRGKDLQYYYDVID